MRNIHGLIFLFPVILKFALQERDFLHQDARAALLLRQQSGVVDEQAQYHKECQQENERRHISDADQMRQPVQVRQSDCHNDADSGEQQPHERVLVRKFVFCRHRDDHPEEKQRGGEDDEVYNIHAYKKPLPIYMNESAKRKLLSPCSRSISPA